MKKNRLFANSSKKLFLKLRHPRQYWRDFSRERHGKMQICGKAFQREGHFPFVTNSPVVYRLARGRKRVIRMPLWNLMREKVEIRGKRVIGPFAPNLLFYLSAARRTTRGYGQCRRQLCEKRAAKAELLSKTHQGWD